MGNTKKIVKLGKSYINSKITPLPLWVHLWVTDKCNLTCDYCEVVDNTKKNPTESDVKNWISHADNLGSSIIAFMGGEPTLRKDLPDLIRFASERDLLTYVTSHGKINSLSDARLSQLGEAGLNVVEVSIDGYDSVVGSEKTLNGDESLIDRLENVKREYGTRYKAHQVLFPANLTETPKLVELSQRRNLPMTFGLVSDNVSFKSGERTIYEDSKLKEGIKKTLRFLLDKKREGAPIMNVESYFVDALRFIDEPIRWSCDVGTYMIQVSTNGEIFKCSKYMKLTTGTKFLDINQDYFKYDLHQSNKLLDKCNDKCLSACGYNTSYFRRNPIRFASNALKMR